MIEKKALLCQNCGGHIDRASMKCPYCGTQYERKYENVTLLFEADRRGEHTIVGEIDINYDDLKRIPPDVLQRRIMDHMRHCIADALLEYMRITTAENYMNFSQTIRGEVRVIDLNRTQR